MHLARDAFNELVRLCSLAQQNLFLLPAEWDSIYSILVQILKIGQFQVWRGAENAAGVTLSPDFFQLAGESAPPLLGLYSTGLDNDGLPLANGAIDLHWTITATPSGEGNASAYATMNSNPIGTAWIANSYMSRWISPQTNEALGDAPGTYRYRTTFNLTRFDPTTVQIIAEVAVDDTLTDVQLNGQSLKLTAKGAAAFTPLSINSGYVAGVNRLEFVVNNTGTAANPSGLRVEFALTALPRATALPRWRATDQARQAWQDVLQARMNQQQALGEGLRAAVDATEQATLPMLRDALLQATGQSADALTKWLLIDVAGSSYVKTTRVGQAIETLQNLFRTLVNQPSQRWVRGNTVWVLAETAPDSNSANPFNQEWAWEGSYPSWQAAMRVFYWPENALWPTLRNVSKQPSKVSDATQAFQNLAVRLRNYSPLTPRQAREEAAQYLKDLLKDLGSPPLFPSDSNLVLNDQLDEQGLLQLQQLVMGVFTQSKPPINSLGATPVYLQEVFYFVPLHLALQLQHSGQFEAALHWLRTIYAYEWPATAKRKIYYGLVLEESTATTYQPTPHWLQSLNPHDIVWGARSNAYTRFTLLSIMHCLLDYADSEYASDTSESVTTARDLYMSGIVLLNLPELSPSTTNDPNAATIANNPVTQGLRLHAQTNLAKLRSGRNIAGMLRQLDPFTAQSQRTTPGTISLAPTPYHYSTLVERAKQFVTLAQQIESSYLSALEKSDAESYNFLKAQQDLDTAQGRVSLQALRVVEAQDGVKLAQDQQYRARIEAGTYQQWLDAGVSDLEKASLASLAYAAALQIDAAAVNFVNPAAVGQGFSSLAGAASTIASIFSAFASYEQRAREWQLRQDLAQQDGRIGQQQITLATDRQEIAVQEQAIAQMQADHAQAIVTFLANKFTNAHLYEWMSGVLGRVYGYFLQQATAIARLAQDQLSFERQEKSLGVIQANYWNAPSDMSANSNGKGTATDRKGLTGSARLLQDIYQLDQYAFETNKRKLQLTKTISLARMAPVEFQRFRETGVLLFATPMELFDRDFPGHYVRIVRRARITVPALIPPTLGIRGTLSNPGISRVTIGGDVFQDAAVRRDPESVALSSPVNATGLFELDTQPELLLPFEGLGVDTSWEFRIPKAANPFDYRTIADVLMTIEYTALNSFDYRQQVIRRLKRTVSADRPFSFRQEFADQWYDLHNSGQSTTPMTMMFKTGPADFPPNVEEMTLQHLVLYAVPAEGKSFQLGAIHLQLTKHDKDKKVVVGEGDATPVDGLISTRSGSGGGWYRILEVKPIPSPFGEWVLKFPDKSTRDGVAVDTKDLFSSEAIEDILFVVTYNSLTPEWPM